MIFIILCVITVILSVVYKYLSRNYNYWYKRNVPHIKPTFPFGNFTETFTFKKTLGECFSMLYNKFDSPYFGAYILDKPCLVVKDPELIKHVLVKDFDYFSDRFILSHEECDPIASFMLFFAKNPEWRYMRTKITPFFSSGKMKNMFNLMKEVGADMTSYLTEVVTDDVIEIKEICGKYSTNVITSCAFGLNANSFQNENAPFRKYAKMMFDTNFKNGFNQSCYFLSHTIVKILRVPFFDHEILNFMRGVFWKTIEERERTLEVRNDLIDVIKDFKKQPDLNENFKFEGDKVLAQAAQFFSAGFETVSSTMAFALYELTFCPEVQDKLRSEIKDAISKYEELNYDCVESMIYLNMVIEETLRKYPVLPFLDRKCVRDYKIPNTDVIVSKGTPVYISALGIQNDPKYYPNPEKFDPERFSNYNKQNMTRYTFLPFGDGQRNCIGARFGMISTKIGLIHILLNYKILPCPITPKSITFSARTFFLASVVGIPVTLKKISAES